MEGYPWGNGNDRAGLWQWDYATPKEVGGVLLGRPGRDWRVRRVSLGGGPPAMLGVITYVPRALSTHPPKEKGLGPFSSGYQVITHEELVPLFPASTVGC